LGPLIRGEVLIMCRFDMEASDLNGAFTSGLSSGLADKVLDAFPSLKASASNAREEVLIVRAASSTPRLPV
jgi:hypothetical protein